MSNPGALRRRPVPKSDDEPITLGQALDAVPHLPWLREGMTRSVTLIRQVLLTGSRRWLSAAGLPLTLSELALADVDRAMIIRIRGALAQGMPQPAEKELRLALNGLFKLALAQGWIKTNPMRDQPPVMGTTSKLHAARQRREMRHAMPDADQVDLLLSDCNDWVARADWLTIEASARPQEVRAVVWTDIKLHPRRNGRETGGTLTILRSMGYGKHALVPGHTKTDQSQRTVQFGPDLARHLRAAMPPPAQRHHYVVSPDGQPVTGKKLLIGRQMRQARLGIAEVVGRRSGQNLYAGFYDGRMLRHAFAARRISQGTPHTTLARQMGHKHYRMTLNIYGYLFSKAAAFRAKQQGRPANGRSSRK